jgi:hypothetical protein
MTFSPEDAYASNVPVPDEDQFDTGGLELKPLGGDEGAAGPLDKYTAEQQAADAKRYNVSSLEATVSDAEVMHDNPYNLATEAQKTDEDGLEVEIDTLTDAQKDALASLIPDYKDRKNGQFPNQNRASDYELYQLGFNQLKDGLKNFSGSKVEGEALKQSYLKMRNAFPDFSLGEEVRVEYNDGSAATFR